MVEGVERSEFHWVSRADERSEGVGILTDGAETAAEGVGGILGKEWFRRCKMWVAGVGGQMGRGEAMCGKGVERCGVDGGGQRVMWWGEDTVVGKVRNEVSAATNRGAMVISQEREERREVGRLFVGRKRGRTTEETTPSIGSDGIPKFPGIDEEGQGLPGGGSGGGEDTGEVCRSRRQREEDGAL